MRESIVSKGFQCGDLRWSIFFNGGMLFAEKGSVVGLTKLPEAAACPMCASRIEEKYQTCKLCGWETFKPRNVLK